MKIPNSAKKDILNDWYKEFNILSPYAQNKLYKIIGPVVAGIEFFKLPRTDDYRPYFACYPLWKSNEKECLDEPVVLQEILNNRELQFNIPYLHHMNFFQEAVECTRKQLLISLDKDVSLKNLYSMIDNQFSHILVKSSPISQAKLYETKFFAALYVNDKFFINKVLDDIKEASQNWLPNLFEWKLGKFDNWFQGLQEKTNRREEFIKQVEANRQDKKMLKLKSSELIV